jgi:hypothetical protein
VQPIGFHLPSASLLFAHSSAEPTRHHIFIGPGGGPGPAIVGFDRTVRYFGCSSVKSRLTSAIRSIRAELMVGFCAATALRRVPDGGLVVVPGLP